MGGVWNVHGGYTFHTLSKYQIDRAYLADTFYTDITLAFAKKFPQLELIQGDIRDLSTFDRIGLTDLIIFFDVLLHQINWKDILSACAAKTKIIAVYQPRYLEKRTVRLPELRKERYFSLIPILQQMEKYKIYNYLYADRHNSVKDSPAI